MANTVTFTCRQCGKASAEALSQAGKTTCCRHCGAENRVPVPGSAAPQAGGGQIKIGCGLCGHRQYVSQTLAGQPIACESCGKKIRVPAARPAAPAQARSTAPVERNAAAPPRQKVKAAPVPSEPADAPLGLFDDDSGSSEVVPLELDTEVQPLSPRGSFQPVRSTPAADTPESPLPTGPKKKKRKKKSTYGLNADDVKTIGWAIIGLTVIVGGAAIALPGVRSTIGLTMIVIGGLVMLLGNAGFASVVREEGAIHYLMCRYVPLYSLYFLVTRWDRMRDHVMLATVGTVILAPGILLFSIAPDVKKDMGEDDDEDEPAATKPATKDAGQPPMPVKEKDEEEG